MKNYYTVLGIQKSGQHVALSLCSAEAGSVASTVAQYKQSGRFVRYVAFDSGGFTAVYDKDGNVEDDGVVQMCNCKERPGIHPVH